MLVPSARLALLSLVAALILTACAGEGRAETYGHAHTPALADLLDGPWVADAIEDPHVEIVPGSQIEMTFHDESLTAVAGCNSMRGGVAIDGGDLVVSTLASTQKACQDDLMKQDAWLSDFLESRPSIERLGRDLWLARDDTVIHLVQS